MVARKRMPRGTAQEMGPLPLDLLHRLASRGPVSLRTLFDRRDPAWVEPAPSWAMEASQLLLLGGLIVADGDQLALTPRGWEKHTSRCVAPAPSGDSTPLDPVARPASSARSASLGRS